MISPLCKSLFHGTKHMEVTQRKAGTVGRVFPYLPLEFFQQGPSDTYWMRCSIVMQKHNWWWISVGLHFLAHKKWVTAGFQFGHYLQWIQHRSWLISSQTVPTTLWPLLDCTMGLQPLLPTITIAISLLDTKFSATTINFLTQHRTYIRCQLAVLFLSII